MDAKVNTKSSVGEIRGIIEDLTHEPKWKRDRYWKEFIKEVTKKLSSLNIGPSPKVDEMIQIEQHFQEWVKDSKEWWGGDWANKTELAEWIVRRWVKRNKSEPQATMAEVKDTSETRVQDEPEPMATVSETSDTMPKAYYDPIKDNMLLRD